MTKQEERKKKPQETPKKPHWQKVLDDPVVKLIFERLKEL